MQNFNTEIFTPYDDGISFNFNKFFKNQIKINDSFPNPNRGTNFITVFDSMTGQILEEIHETNQEIYLAENNKTTVDMYDKALEELIDVIMYTGSLFLEACYYFKVDPLQWIVENGLETIYFFDSEKHQKNAKIHGDFVSILRREIYDRKYHKKHNKEPKDYISKFLWKTISFSFFPNEKTELSLKQFNDMYLLKGFFTREFKSLYDKYILYALPYDNENIYSFINTLVFSHPEPEIQNNKIEEEVIGFKQKFNYKINKMNDYIKEKQAFIAEL